MTYIKEFKKGEDISKYSSAKDLLLDHYGEDFYNWLEIQMKELSPVTGKENWRLRVWNAFDFNEKICKVLKVDEKEEEKQEEEKKKTNLNTEEKKEEEKKEQIQ